MILILVSTLTTDIIKRVDYFVYCVVLPEKLLKKHLLSSLLLKHEQHDDRYYTRCKYILEKLFIKLR